MKNQSSLKSKLLLKAFLSSCDPKHRALLESFLSENEKETLLSLREIDRTIQVDLFSYAHILEKVHWSWFLPTLKTYSELEQKLFLSALNPFAAKNLAKELMLSLNGNEISEIGRSYLKKLLFDSLRDENSAILPPEYLPPSALNKLLDLSKKELTHLIETLSLHDLFLELRHIVDTKILKKIQAYLTSDEKKILRQIQSDKEHFPVGKMGLERWDGTEEQLRTLMHKRGLARFAVALSGQNLDFIWYLCHQLDIGRGLTLLKLCVDEPIPHLSEAVIKQIEERL